MIMSSLQDGSTPAAVCPISPATLARALGGGASGTRVRAPGPGHPPQDRSLVIDIKDDAPDGFLVHSFAGDDPTLCKDYVRQRAGLPAWQRTGDAESAARKGRGRPAPRARIVAEYVYRQADGTPYLRVQ